MSKLFITLARAGVAATALIALAPRTAEAQRAAAGDVAPSSSAAILAPAALGHASATLVRPAFGAQAEERSSFATAIVGAGLGTVVGVVVGAAVGGSTADCNYRFSETDFCGLGEAVIGAAAGGAVGSASGAWLGARSRGGTPSVVWTGLAGLGGIGTGYLAGMFTDRTLGVSGTITVLAYLAGQALLPALVAAGS